MITLVERQTRMAALAGKIEILATITNEQFELFKEQAINKLKETQA